jgi:hypothetical protein
MYYTDDSLYPENMHPMIGWFTIQNQILLKRSGALVDE